MPIESWLKKRVAEDHYPRKSPGGAIAALFFIGVLTLAVFRRRSPSEWAGLVAGHSPQDRLALLAALTAIIAALFGLRWFLRSIPIGLAFRGYGWRGQLTGGELRSLRRAENRLIEKLQAVYRSVPRPPAFSEAAFKAAGKRWETFRPMRLADLEACSGEPWFKILVLSGAIGARDGSVVRLVEPGLVRDETA